MELSGITGIMGIRWNNQELWELDGITRNYGNKMELSGIMGIRWNYQELWELDGITRNYGN